MNSETVQYLANLARLDIPESEQASIAKDLENIIGFVDQIQKVTVSANDAIISRTNIFRDDVVAPLASQYDLIDAAPSHEDGYVKVPKVIE